MTVSGLFKPPLVPGEVVTVAPGIRRVLAPNPSVMTGPGTNTYIVGTDDVVVIDPGPVDEGHLQTVADAAGGHLRYVVVTHTHRDHAPGAAPLARATGATILGFDARDGFDPDGIVRDLDVISTDDWELQALFTPGHASNHLCFVGSFRATAASMSHVHRGDSVGRIVFSGDHVKGGSTVVIGPPDGDMTDYLASLDRLKMLEPPYEAIAPGHGQVIDDPYEVLEGYIRHRLAREQEVLVALGAGPAAPSELVDLVYGPIDPALRRAASRSLWAHLRKLGADGQAVATDADDPEARWQLASG